MGAHGPLRGREGRGEPGFAHGREPCREQGARKELQQWDLPTASPLNPLHPRSSRMSQACVFKGVTTGQFNSRSCPGARTPQAPLIISSISPYHSTTSLLCPAGAPVLPTGLSDLRLVQRSQGHVQ